VAVVIVRARVADREHEIRIVRREAGYCVTVDGVDHFVDAHKLEADFYSILVDRTSYEVSVEHNGDTYRVRHGASERIVHMADPSRAGREEARKRSGPEAITAVMPGKVVRVLVVEGQTVMPEQGLVVVEAMKMENEIQAPHAGRIKSIAVQPGQAVETGAELVVLE
jgi:biotin carboxyl carrier protein